VERPARWAARADSLLPGWAGGTAPAARIAAGRAPHDGAARALRGRPAHHRHPGHRLEGASAAARLAHRGHRLWAWRGAAGGRAAARRSRRAVVRPLARWGAALALGAADSVLARGVSGSGCCAAAGWGEALGRCGAMARVVAAGRISRSLPLAGGGAGGLPGIRVGSISRAGAGQRLAKGASRPSRRPTSEWDGQPPQRHPAAAERHEGAPQPAAAARVQQQRARLLPARRGTAGLQEGQPPAAPRAPIARPGRAAGSSLLRALRSPRRAPAPRPRAARASGMGGAGRRPTRGRPARRAGGRASYAGPCAPAITLPQRP
jgi:hypothetical protein